MPSKKILYTAIGALFFLGIFAHAMYRESKIKKEVKRMSTKFPEIVLSDDIKGKISKVIDYKSDRINNDPNRAFVVINDSVYRSIIVGLELNSGNNLDDLISTGDLIKKVAGENTIEMYKVSEGGDSTKFVYEIADEKGNLIKKK